MKIDEISEIFLTTLQFLSTNEKYYMYTNQGQYMNFRSGDFRKALFCTLSQKQMETTTKKYGQLMQMFRTFQWILCQDNRYTTTQWISGKPIRVITVSREKYELLKNLDHTDEDSS